MILLLAFLASALSTPGFLQIDLDDYVTVFSSVETFDSMQGSMSTDQNGELTVLTLLKPDEDAGGLTWNEIEDTDDQDELQDTVEDSENPDAQAWV